MPTQDEMRKAIVEFVVSERKRLGIPKEKLSTDFLPEGSCFHQGEFYNLLYAQLIRVHEGHASWKELDAPEILEGTFQVVRAIQESRRLKPL